MKSNRSLALLGLILLMIVWGGTFVVTKVAAYEIPPLALAALRFLIASAVLVPLALARGGMKLLPRPLPFGTLLWMAASGIALFTISFNYALVFASASQGALIYALLPAAIALAAVLILKERPTVRRIAGIVLSIGGVAFVIGAGEQDAASQRPVVGALWMLGAVVSWTVYTVFAKRLAAENQLGVIALVSVFGVLLLLPPAAIELMSTEWQPPSLQAWVGMLFLGVVASALAYIVYSYALRVLDASLVGVFTNLDPIVGVLTAVLFLGETLHTGQWVGGAIAFAGMWLASTQNSDLESASIDRRNTG